MDFYEAVQRRRTVRDFAEKKVPDKVVTRILEAGLKAPTNDHLRQWEFVVLRDARSIETALGQVGENAGRVGAPEGYVMPCYLALGYPAEGISYPEQEQIDPAKKFIWKDGKRARSIECSIPSDGTAAFFWICHL